MMLGTLLELFYFLSMGDRMVTCWPFWPPVEGGRWEDVTVGSSWTQAIETPNSLPGPECAPPTIPMLAVLWRKQPCGKVWLWFSGLSLAVQRLKPSLLLQKGMGLFPSQGTEVSLATWPDHLDWICDWSQIRPPCKLSRFWGQMWNLLILQLPKVSLAGKFPCLFACHLLIWSHLSPSVSSPSMYGHQFTNLHWQTCSVFLSEV